MYIDEECLGRILSIDDWGLPKDMKPDFPELVDYMAQK
jgi:hypothetical protein